MKKLLLSILVIALLLVGCAEEPTVEYSNALGKSFSVNSGQMSVEMDMTIKDDSIKNETIVQFESENDQDAPTLKLFNHTEANDFGYDSVSYYFDKKVYIEIPMVGKVIVMDTDEYVKQAEAAESNNSFNDMGERLKKVLESDNVVALENTLVETLEGKVKAKKFSVVINSEKLQELQEIIADAVEAMSLEVTLSGIESIKSEAYIDFDGYLVKQSFDVTLDNGEKMVLTIKLWDFGRKQNIELPNYDQDDIIENFEELENMDFGGNDE